MNISKQIFSERLSLFIKSSKLKQKDIAVKLRITTKHLSQLVRGKANPSDKLLDDLHKFYGLNLIWLETGEGELSISNNAPALILNNGYSPSRRSYDKDPLQKRIIEICGELNLLGKKALLNLAEGLYTDPDFKPAQNRRKEA